MTIGTNFRYLTNLGAFGIATTTPLPKVRASIELRYEEDPNETKQAPVHFHQTVTHKVIPASVLPPSARVAPKALAVHHLRIKRDRAFARLTMLLRFSYFEKSIRSTALNSTELDCIQMIRNRRLVINIFFNESKSFSQIFKLSTIKLTPEIAAIFSRAIYEAIVKNDAQRTRSAEILVLNNPKSSARTVL
jgi:hypothetical protein